MKLNEFAKKHANDRVAFKGELLISNAQVHRLNMLKEALGAKFVNERATEVLGPNYKGLKLNDLKRAQADQIIEAVESYQHEVTSGARIPTGIPETVSRARKSHHTDDQPAYLHQLDHIGHLCHKYSILYGVMCLDGLGKAVDKEHLTVLQARSVIGAAQSIARKREKWPMWRHTKEVKNEAE